MARVERFRIEQSDTYAGSNYWNWSTWIEGNTSDLDVISSVEWILHPSFQPSRVIKKSRRHKFRLDASAWGTFLLHAVVRLKDRTTVGLRHQLKLYYPEGGSASRKSDARSKGNTASRSMQPSEVVTSAEREPTVFLSYASEDYSNALQIVEQIRQFGVRVVDARSVGSDEPIDVSIRKLIRESDGVVSLVRGEETSPFVIQEMLLARRNEKPVLSFVAPTNENKAPAEALSGASSEILNSQLIHLSDTDAVENAMREFSARLRPGF